MKHIFVVNPTAGRGRAAALLPALERVGLTHGVETEVYRTRGVGDAARFVRERCEQGGKLRFYACGGDGTLHEVVQGAAEQPQAEVAAIPCGSGNDFVRTFGSPETFLDLSRQIRGRAQPIDLLRLEDGRYCINMINIGFDCAVAAGVHEVQERWPVSGSAAYLCSLARTFFRPLGETLRLTIEDEPPIEGKFLLTAIGNGACCGGGFRALPRAAVTDGCMDLGAIRVLSRMRMLPLLGKYRTGTHLETPIGKTHVLYRQVRKLVVESETPIRICVDGEILEDRRLAVAVRPGALQFSFPLLDEN